MSANHFFINSETLFDKLVSHMLNPFLSSRTNQGLGSRSGPKRGSDVEVLVYLCWVHLQGLSENHYFMPFI